jgi:CHAT domain-containing protein/tetratricopeptide (TPR) repeat protein
MLLWLLWSLLLAAPASVLPVEIRPGPPIEQAIVPGEVRVYTLPLPAGRYARLVIAQHDVDVVATAYRQDGSLLTEVNRPGEWHVEERLAFTTVAAETFRIEVKALPGGANPGHYGIALAELREPAPQDGARIAAERTEAAADRLAQRQTADSFRQAIETYRSARELWRQLGDEAAEAGVLLQIGAAWRFLSDPPKALEALDPALALQKKRGDRAGQAAVLNQMGLVYRGQGQGEKALAAFQEALELRRALGDTEAEGPLLNNIGLLHHSAGRLREALAFYDQALEIFRQRGDRLRAAIVLGNKGSVHRSLGEPLKAIDYHQQSLAMAVAAEDPGSQGDALNNLGLVHHQLGDLQRALEEYTQASALFHGMGDRRRESIALDNVGKLLAELGQPQKALETFEQALKLARDAGARSGEAAVLTGLGQACSALGRSREARDDFEKALALRRETGERGEEAVTLNRLGLHLRSAGQPRQSLDALNRALALQKDLGDRLGEAATLHSLGLTRAALGEAPAALESLARARDLARSIHDPAIEAAALQETARLELARGHPEAAVSQLEPALQIVESLRGQVAGDRLRTSYFASWRDAYEILVEALMELHRRQPDAGYDARAFEVSERSRARGLLDLLRQGHVEIRAGADPQLLDQERTLRAALTGKLQRETSLLSGNAPAGQIEAAHREAEALLAEYELLDARLRGASSRYAGLTRPAEVRLAEVQKLLDPETALLEVDLAEPRSYLWLVTPSVLASFELPAQDVIQEAAKRAYAGLSAPSPRDPAQRQADLAELSRLLLAPVADRLEGKRLAVVAGGALQYVPWAALPDPGSAAGEPLVETHEIVTLPSASILPELRRTAAQRQPASLELAVLADPVFSAGDPRLAVAQRQDPGTRASTLAALSPDAERSARDVGATGFERLTWTRREAEGIAAEANGGRVVTALDFEASRETATGPEVARAPIIHFATHGFLDEEAPELSGLVLSLLDREGNPRDGFLRLRDVYNLDLNASLVVLSGCRTALGKEVRGEGLLGLTRGFLYAGASRVMASLWPVRDRATAELMRRFYHALLHDHLPPAAALRASQRSLRREPRWRDPYFWAPFVMQGDWGAAKP